MGYTLCCPPPPPPDGSEQQSGGVQVQARGTCSHRPYLSHDTYGTTQHTYLSDHHALKLTALGNHGQHLRDMQEGRCVGKPEHMRAAVQLQSHIVLLICWERQRQGSQGASQCMVGACTPI
jgi:hypothetical protein